MNITGLNNNKIIHIISGLSDGGAEAVLYRLVTNDKKINHVIVSMTDEGKYGILLQNHGIKVLCLRFKKNSLNFFCLLKLYKFLKKEKPFAVQTWMVHANIFGGVVSRFAGFNNLIWGIHNDSIEKINLKKGTFFLYKLSLLLSSFIPKKIVICASKSLDNHVSLGYSIKKLIVIHNGYDLNIFKPNVLIKNEIRSELNIKSDDFLIGMVGRYDVLKDHKNLLRAFSLLNSNDNSIKFLLVGNGLNFDNIELINLISKYRLNNRITLIGQQNDIPAIMNAIDLHVLSSKSEAFPNVLAEAMACGTPCASTNVGDAPFIVGEAGWVVQPCNHIALSEAIKEAITLYKFDHLKWLNFNKASRNQIEKLFSIENMITKYHLVWFN
jgi:glycosyltransferase involved in cell wall biosynthesis